ncbi:unnamed protein product [Cuscuta campestris]|uniref:Uncharacterized protein n=1 Tax=Cuscuta campestris TaxID=132261 RepID=A0A484LS43_9ASTE|nr:unnamed protein product [Cuscuta campestris]
MPELEDACEKLLKSDPVTGKPYAYGGWVYWLPNPDGGTSVTNDPEDDRANSLNSHAEAGHPVLHAGQSPFSKPPSPLQVSKKEEATATRCTPLYELIRDQKVKSPSAAHLIEGDRADSPQAHVKAKSKGFGASSSRARGQKRKGSQKSPRGDKKKKKTGSLDLEGESIEEVFLALAKRIQKAGAIYEEVVRSLLVPKDQVSQLNLLLVSAKLEINDRAKRERRLEEELRAEKAIKMKVGGANVHFKKLEAKCSSSAFCEAYLEMIEAQELSEFLHLEILSKYEEKVLEFYRNGEIKTIQSKKNPQRSIQIIESTVGGTEVKISQKKLRTKLYLPNSGIDVGKLSPKALDWSEIGISGKAPTGAAKKADLKNDYKLILELLSTKGENRAGSVAEEEGSSDEVLIAESITAEAQADLEAEAEDFSIFPETSPAFETVLVETVQENATTLQHEEQSEVVAEEEILHSLSFQVQEILTTTCEISNQAKLEIPEKSVEYLEKSTPPNATEEEAQEEPEVEAQRSLEEVAEDAQIARLEASETPIAIFEQQNAEVVRDPISQEISNYRDEEAEEESVKTLKISEEEAEEGEESESLPLQVYHSVPPSHQNWLIIDYLLLIIDYHAVQLLSPKSCRL